MAVIKEEDRTKWINAFVALVGILLGLLAIRATLQLGEWWDLEAKIPYFMGVTQGLGIVAGLSTFFIIKNHSGASAYLQECYGELLKVVWPDRESVVKATIVILIGVTVISLVFLGVDVIFRKLLELVY